MAINLNPYMKVSTNAGQCLLVSDDLRSVGGVNLGNAVNPDLSQIGNLPIAACAEFRSTKGFVVVPRMTEAQRQAIESSATGVNAVTAISDASLYYQTDNTPGLRLRQAGSWITLGAGGGTGDVTGPTTGTTLADQIATFSDTSGKVIKNSTVTLSGAGAFAGIQSIQYGTGPNTTTFTSSGAGGALQFVWPSTGGTAGQYLAKGGGDTLQFVNPPSIPIQSTTVTLSSAQLLALSVTPVTLVTPAIGNIVVVHNISIQYASGGTGYTVPSGSNLIFVINGITVSQPLALAGFLDDTTSRFAGITGIFNNTGIDSGSITGQNLVVTNTVGNLTSGNGTLKITVYYSAFTAI